MKLLTLISKKEVKIAPGTKFLPREEFTQLLSAKELLEEIKKEGLEYRAAIAKEGELLFEKSKREGFEEGLSQWAQQIQFLEEKKEQVQAEVEKVIGKIASIVTKKILDREIKQDPSTVVDIIRKHLKSVSNHRYIEIFVNKKDLEAFQNHRDKLKNIFENVATIAIQQRDDVSEGGAIIETEAGIIDARIESLWVNIENTFEELLKKKK